MKVYELVYTGTCREVYIIAAKSLAEAEDLVESGKVQPTVSENEGIELSSFREVE